MRDAKTELYPVFVFKYRNTRKNHKYPYWPLENERGKKNTDSKQSCTKLIQLRHVYNNGKTYLHRTCGRGVGGPAFVSAACHTYLQVYNLIFLRFSRSAQDPILSRKPRRHVQRTTFPHKLFYFLIAARFSHRRRIVGHTVPVSVTRVKLQFYTCHELFRTERTAPHSDARHVAAR